VKRAKPLAKKKGVRSEGKGRVLVKKKGGSREV